MFVCSGFQADSANSLIRWTFLKASAYRLRVAGRTLNEYSPYSTKPLFAYEYFTHRLGTKMKTMASRLQFGFDLRRGHWVCVAPYYPAKASMEERGILVRSLFFQKNTISPRRSYNFKWQDIYVGVNFLSQIIFVFLLFLGMVMLLMKLQQRKNKNYLRQKINNNIYLYPIPRDRVATHSRR